jgi:hypothetical protein
MAISSSKFYPPRAGRLGWLRRAWFVAGIQLRRLRFPTRLIFGILIPGLGLHQAGHCRTAKVVWGLYAASLLAFFAWLGQGGATVAALLMLALHSISISFVLQRSFPGLRLGIRVVVGLVLFVMVLVLVYMPATRFIGRHLALPLRLEERVVVFNAFSGNRNLARGEFVAYSIPSRMEPGIMVQSGHGMDRLLAGPGDRVVFGPDEFRVNGVSSARREFMPVSGELVVPEMHWFIWPASTRIQGAPAAHEFLLRVAVTDENDIVGRPFKRWFWRRQLSYEPVLQP